MNLVFVYGTLKSGYGNNRLLGTSTFVGEAVTEDTFLLTDCGFPYMIPEEALTDADSVTQAQVVGEVYQVDDEEVMARLDALEGVDYGHYQHKTITVLGAEGSKFETTAYVCIDPSAQQLKICETEGGFYKWFR